MSFKAPVKGVVLQTDRNLDNMVEHLGYVSLKEDSPSFLQGIVKTDRQLVRDMADRLARTVIISDYVLTHTEHNHLELARAIAHSFEGVGSIYAANIPPASDMVMRTAGTYEFGSGKINIGRPELQYAGTTVAVMDHELGHHVAYQRTRSRELAEDLTPDHARAMEYVTGVIVRDLAAGKYDEYLKNAVW